MTSLSPRSAFSVKILFYCDAIVVAFVVVSSLVLEVEDKPSFFWHLVLSCLKERKESISTVTKRFQLL
jgi:hypothetical protein